MNKAKQILLNAIPVLLMIGLIPLVQNDYLLTLLYIVIIVIALSIKHTPYDVSVFAAGFVLLTISEYLFIRTGVETFTRNSLFGVMPLWLPFLWGYGFIAIKRVVEALSQKN